MNFFTKLFIIIIISSFATAYGAPKKNSQSGKNQAPQVRTSANITTFGDSSVTLDGSSSIDRDGYITSYTWRQVSGSPTVIITNSDKSIATFTAPNISTQLTFLLTVTDNSGATKSKSVNVSIEAVAIQATNLLPVAEAVSDLIVDETSLANLNGSASSDSDGTIVGYMWVQTSGTAIAILNANQAKASFIAPDVDSDTQLAFKLTVIDDDGATSSDITFVSITDVSQVNQSPIAVTATDFSADENTTQTLDGSASNDSDGTIASYSWVQTSGSNVTVSGANQSIASFTAPDVDSDTQLTFQLTVTDDVGETNSDSITVSILNIAANQAPTAVVVDDFTVNANSGVVLNGSASSDSDGTIVSYSWIQTAGSPIVVISNPTLANASFIAPDISSSTALTFELMVADNGDLTATDSITVTINPVTVVEPPTPSQATEIPRGVSRTTGVAPLNVFFTGGFSNSSATNREFHSLEYSWNFGDASSGYWGTSNESKNTGKGPIASHLFETAGTYTVSLTVRNASGIVDTGTFTISVSDPDDIFSGTKTTCISDVSKDDFTGCPVGSNQVTTDNIAEMASYVGSGRRVLLQRGSVWSRSGKVSFSDSTTVQIGAFGSCQTPDSLGICSNAPVVNLTGSAGLFDIDRMHDMRITDITINGSSSADGITEGGIDTQQLLIFRVKTTGHENALSWTKWRDSSSHKIAENAVISSDFSETGINTVYIGSEKLSFMGNIVANSKTGHVVRIWFAYQAVISHNRISGSSYISGDGLHAIKFHGPNESNIGTLAETGSRGLPYRSKFTVISNNVIGGSGPWPISIGPQSSSHDERLSDIIMEKNKVLAAYGTKTPDLASKGIMFEGRYFTVRNNILDGSGGAVGYTGIDVARRGIEATPLGHRVYNNTIYSNSASSGAVGVQVHSSASDTIIRNNFVSFPSTSNQTLVKDYSGNAVFDHNIINNNHGFVDPNNSNSLLKNFSLISTSPAINQGVNVPVLDDLLGFDRAINSYSAGAFSY